MVTQHNTQPKYTGWVFDIQKNDSARTLNTHAQKASNKSDLAFKAAWVWDFINALIHNNRMKQTQTSNIYVWSRIVRSDNLKHRCVATTVSDWKAEDLSLKKNVTRIYTNTEGVLRQFVSGKPYHFRLIWKCEQRWKNHLVEIQTVLKRLVVHSFGRKARILRLLLAKSEISKHMCDWWAWRYKLLELGGKQSSWGTWWKA